MERRPWVRAARAGAAALALTTMVGAGRAQAVPPHSAAGPAAGVAQRPDITVRTVTLITGDRVVVRMQGKRPQLMTIEPGAGRTHVSFGTLTAGGRLRVIPSDAMPLIRAGRVDPRLFDVTTLLDNGYDDRRADLPVMMIGRQATAPAQSAARAQAHAATGAHAMRNVPGGAGFHLAKGTAGSFWRAFVAAPATRAASGGSKLWLDAIHRLDLKDSVPQIGAPVAWAAGFTGVGVTVGVVDTGIDSTHPDLAGRVVAAQDFTGADDTRDFVGHGTHVAATVASVDSVYRGVAPDAHLVSAKACDDFGCSESALLAAMQYSIDQGAKIINMSLGGTDSPDIDPLEAAVNQLTAQDGVLFVVAAGNDGAPASIESPGSADAALTVGAVDKSDQLAFFSSQGPRVGDQAVKPDITAPGVDITAARSKDAELGNPGDLRLTLSGTSMATPHVAGSAAILLQEHPTWTPAELKEALMGSALRNTGLDPFQQGAGRVDVAHEITQNVLADPPSVSFATEQFPHTDDVPDARTVTYHNMSGSPVTLQLSLLDSAPAGMFGLSADTVTVPANGTATVDVTADTNLDVPNAEYTGYLVAQAPAGTVTTPFAVFKAPESHALTFHYVNRAGQPTDNVFGALVDPSNGAFIFTPDNGGTLVVPKSTYAFVEGIFEDDGSATMLIDPVVAADTDRDVTADARNAKPVTVTAPLAGAQPFALIAEGEISSPLGPTVPVIASFDGTPIYTGSDDPSITAPYMHGLVLADFFAPHRPGADPTDYVEEYYHSSGRLFDGLIRHPGKKDLAAFDVTYASDGHTMGFYGTQPQWPDYTPDSFPATFVDMPSHRTEYLNVDDGQQWLRELIALEDDGFTPDYVLVAPIVPLTGGKTYVEKRFGAVFGPGFGQPFFERAPAIGRRGDTLILQPALGNDRLNWTSLGEVDGGTLALTLTRDGQVIDTGEFSLVTPVSPGDAVYELTAESVRGGQDGVSTSVSSVWTFHSATVPDAFTPIPVNAVRFLPDLSGTNTAPAGRVLAVPVEVQSQPGAPVSVRSLTVQVSYDDGVTWHEVTVSRSGASAVAVVRSPASGFVSLRATATNSGGNSVTETIIRAYGVS
ncbi:MAG TPA: S8 family serine peptidase [Micromonosporaceae bacterium]|nr:S8 family serine peptidase [Micromonosporaceae bacterium]